MKANVPGLGVVIFTPRVGSVDVYACRHDLLDDEDGQYMFEVFLNTVRSVSMRPPGSHVAMSFSDLPKILVSGSTPKVWSEWAQAIRSRPDTLASVVSSLEEAVRVAAYMAVVKMSSMLLGWIPVDSFLTAVNESVVSDIMSR